jgi:hypoxia up-regulated 1
VQDVLSSIVKKELGKNLNTDEAMALGAVYQAAYQSKGYKVKKFYIRDLATYPIVVSSRICRLVRADLLQTLYLMKG